MFILYQRIPFILNIVIGPILAYVSMAMNVMVFYILSAKELINIATILMRALAVADCLTSFCTYGLEPMFNFFYTALKKDNITEKTAIDELIDLKYPYCILHYMTSQLADTFHMTSVFLTSCLGLQKMVAVIFPIWSRVNMTNRKGYCLMLLCYLLPISISLPKICFIRVSSREENNCISINNKAFQSYILKYYPMLVTVILIVLSIAMIISTIIIIAVLMNRRSIRGRNSMSDKEKKSCFLIIIVVVVFLASEIPRTHLNVSLFGEYNQETVSDIVLDKIKSKIVTHTALCFEKVQINDTDSSNSDSMIYRQNRTLTFYDHLVNELLLNQTNTLQLFYYTQMTEWISINYFKFRDKNYLRSWAKTARSFYYALTKHTNTTSNNLREYLLKNEVNSYAARKAIIGYFDCVEQSISSYHNKLTYLYLAVFPYNEKMNYMINVSMNTWKVELEELKTFIEILKISTIIACASNFVIYVMLSQKIKERINRKLFHWPF